MTKVKSNLDFENSAKQVNVPDPVDPGDGANRSWVLAQIPGAATESAAGIVEKATDAEGIALADTTRYASPSVIAAILSNKALSGTGLIPIDWNIITISGTGAGVTAVTLDGVRVIKYHVGDMLGVNQADTFAYWFQIPETFSSFPASNLVIEVTKVSTPDSLTVTATNVRTGTVDPTVNAANILSSVTYPTYENKTLSMTGTYLPGDWVFLQFDSVVDGGETNILGRMAITFTKK